jgi:acetyl esterase/lipase
MVGPRALPPPADASEIVREAIAATPAPDPVSRRQAVPRTDAEWRAAQQASSQADLAKLGADNGVSIVRDEIAGVAVYLLHPKEPNAQHAAHLFLHLHGGAYVFGGGDAAVSEAALIAGSLGIEAISVDYRMPPEHPFPAAVDDAVAVYRSLIEARSAGSILIGGTSAGGGLSLATVHRLQALDVDPPGAVYAGTPWADLTKTGDTLFSNEGVDRILVVYEGLLEDSARLYAGGRDLEDPLLSPVYGDFTGFPPTVLITGTRDMFLSDTVRTHRKLRAAGVDADLHVFEGLSHAEYLFSPGSTEARQMLDELGAFAAAHLSP